jgi:GR25 family glycosyltransferase involved in LPS biosynthesis
MIFFLFLCIVSCLVLVSHNKREEWPPASTETVVIAIPERKKRAVRFLRAMGLDDTAVVFDAVLKQDLEKDPHLSGGQLACALSHMTVWARFLESGDSERLMVFEDDVKPPSGSGIRSDVGEALRELPRDWDICFLGWCWSDCGAHQKVSKHLDRVRVVHCTHAYVLSRKGARKLLDAIREPLTQPIDEYISALTASGAVKSHVVRKPLFFQDRENLGSTVVNTGDLRLCF